MFDLVLFFFFFLVIRLMQSHFIDFSQYHRQVLENSISELRKTVTELEKKLSSVEDEGK